MGARAERHERRAARKEVDEEVGATDGRRAPLPALDVGFQPHPYNRSSRFSSRAAGDDKELDLPCIWSSVCDKPPSDGPSLPLLPSTLCLHLPAGIERATQRLMRMRTAQPSLMPDPRCLDAPPPGMMQLCHRESVVQFINEVRCPRPHCPLCPTPSCPVLPLPHALLPPLPRAPPPARNACPSAPTHPPTHLAPDPALHVAGV